MMPWTKGAKATKNTGVEWGTTWDEGAADYMERAGGKSLLLSTALLHMKQRKTDDDKKIFKKVTDFITAPEPAGNAGKANHKILRQAMKEVEIFESKAEGGVYANQETNIDPVWLCFFVAFKIAKVGSIDQFYLYQRDLPNPNACKKIRGANNMKHVLGAMAEGGLVGMQSLRNALSECTRINLPPWVLKPSRLYDAAAPIGACDVLNAFNTLDHPTFSWRYSLLRFQEEKRSS